MDELSLDEVTPSKPSRHPEQIREPATDISAFFRAQPADQHQPDVVQEDDDNDTIPARSFGRLARPRNPADATFLTECSFGVAHDALVKLITDVQPFEPYWEELRSIDLRGKGVDSVARLKEFLPKLEEIKLNENAISYLSGIPSSVRTLHVPSNRLTSLTSVNHLRNLQYLDISRNQLDSVSQLSCLVHLRELKADDNKISSLNGILDMDGLIRLSVKSNQLERLDLADAKWTRLEVLELADNTITAIKGLESLSSLRVLNMDDNDLTSLAPSRPLATLRELRVNNNDLYTLDLTDFPRLKTVYADENRLRTLHRSAGGVGRIEALSMRNQRCSGLHISARELESVKRLYISGNEIKPTFFPESPLYKLEYLEAVACRLSAWPARMVDRMPGLRVLNLNYNFLDHLDGLSGMTGLRRVTVVGNRLGGSATGGKVMRGLKGLTGLEEVDLRMNPSTLGFYLPVLSHPSSPEPGDTRVPSNSNGNGNKTAILLGRPNYTVLGASQTSRAGNDRLEIG
ncbi:hypothetical protein EHS25_000968 [Saitozyma podzolica]|uniref:Disease resistance R13L4/SHOC-2-like LRR domain-containing protein n=1 Tax=Saitozyma podzolica TaxID=1890683 RepID=A0A427YH68_9TREE|nr:hypothetical protein EHS25_000968 [Saitozyma podzolica]